MLALLISQSRYKAKKIKKVNFYLLIIGVVLMTSGERVKDLRKSLKLTQTEFGLLAGVSKQAVYQWEKDVNQPDREALRNLQKNKKINPEYLLDGVEPPFLEKLPLHIKPPSSDLTEVLQLIRQYQQAIPVDVEAIVYDLGITVETLSSLKDTDAGYIKYVNGKYVIGINASHHPHRKRFTLAHELAHYFLHKDLINGDGINDNTLYRSFKPEVNERDANRLAALILMPNDFVNEFFDNPDCYTLNVKEFADRFLVSEQAMAIQLGIPFNQ